MHLAISYICLTLPPYTFIIVTFCYPICPVTITRFILNYMSTLFTKRPSFISCTYNSNAFILFSTTLLTILGEFSKYSGHSGPYIDLSHTLGCQSRIIGLFLSMIDHVTLISKYTYTSNCMGWPSPGNHNFLLLFNNIVTAASHLLNQLNHNLSLIP